MLVRRRGTFLGGAFLPSRKARTASAPIEPMPIGDRLRVPLAEGNQPPAAPVVHPEDRVVAGQLIARETQNGLAVHAPASGRVTALTAVDTTECFDVPCVEIATDPGQQPLVVNEKDRPATPPPADRDQDAWFEMIQAGGLIGVEGGVSPWPSQESLASLLRTAKHHRVRNLVINGLETEPYLTGAHRILIEHADDVISGGIRLRTLLGKVRVWLAVAEADRELIKRLRRQARSVREGRVRVIGVDTKYPGCSARLLAPSLLGRRVPPAGRCLDVRVCVLDVRTVLAANWAMEGSWSCTSSIVTISGEKVRLPGNYRIAIGTPVADVLRLARTDLSGTPVVLAGGPLTGRAITSLETVVTKSTTTILVLDAQREQRGPTACVRCGWCVDDCPVGLDPLALLNAAETGNQHKARRLHVEGCIGCGVCSYVCPSGLPLASSIRSLKVQLRIGFPPSAGPGSTDGE